MRSSRLSSTASLAFKLRNKHESKSVGSLATTGTWNAVVEKIPLYR